MATQEMYDRVKNLTKNEIIEVAKYCCEDINESGKSEEECFCGNKCPYLDVRKEEVNPNRFCRQWVIHDLIKIIEESENGN